MTEIMKDIHTDDVTDKVLNLSGIPEENRSEIEEAVCWIENAAKNKLNADYWRVFYKALQSLPDSCSAVCDTSVIGFMECEIKERLKINDEPVDKDVASEIADLAFSYYTHSTKHYDVPQDATQLECVDIAIDHYCEEHGITTYSK